MQPEALTFDPITDNAHPQIYCLKNARNETMMKVRNVTMRKTNETTNANNEI